MREPVPDLTIEFVRHEMCEGCAFRPGTAANLNWLTLMKAKLCVKSGEPFICHANIDANQEPVDGVTALCRGFHDAFKNRLDNGIEEPQWRRELYLVLTAAIAEIENTPALHNNGEAQTALVDERIREWITKEFPR